MLLFDFYIFISLLNFIFTFAAFIPNGRHFHSSVLIDKKLYFSGGFINNSLSNITNEFFYLDVSKPFTTADNDSIQWVDLTYTDGPLKQEATAGDFYANQSFVNQYDTSKQQWINISSVGNVPANRRDFSCANFDNGLIAIFSGFFNTTYRINDLWIFNTLTLAWSLSNTKNTPLHRNGYCAVTLPDGNILYIGGYSSANSLMPMDNLPLYNTKSDTWTNMVISGTIPPARMFFSAVLIFSGLNDANLGDLWILDIIMSQWSIGKILNPIMNLTLYGHTATLVNNYMFVAFGMFPNLTLSSKIFMLDVSRKDSYKWVTEFTPNTTTTPNSSNISLIVGVTIGSIISL
ncbi:42667_t:CDS:2, partial [Gigaspora margarita]